MKILQFKQKKNVKNKIFKRNIDNFVNIRVILKKINTNVAYITSNIIWNFLNSHYIQMEFLYKVIQ